MPKVRRCKESNCHSIVERSHYFCDKHRSKEADYVAKLQKWARSRNQYYQTKYNKVTRNRNKQKREQYEFYKTREWKKLRGLVLDRDTHVDQYLKPLGIYEVANTVDHIIPIEFAPELKSSPQNLVSCSRQTHLIKTRWEQEYYFDEHGNKKNVKPITEIETIIKFLAPHFSPWEKRTHRCQFSQK